MSPMLYQEMTYRYH